MLKRLWGKLWKKSEPEPEHNWKPELVRMTAVLQQSLEREANLKDAVRDLTYEAQVHELRQRHSLRNHAYIVQVTNCMNRLVAANIDWFDKDQQRAMLAAMNAAMDAIDHAEMRRNVDEGTFKE